MQRKKLQPWGESKHIHINIFIGGWYVMLFHRCVIREMSVIFFKETIKKLKNKTTLINYNFEYLQNASHVSHKLNRNFSVIS